MSQQNVELARRGYEALMRGDLDSVAELFAADLSLVRRDRRALSRR
jgi:ketosteroid isomerase-like protein